MKKLLIAGMVAIMLSACSTTSYSVKRYDDTISFYAKIPKAKVVYFVSNLTNLKKIKSKKESKDIWKTTLHYTGGVIRYYIVDGKIYLPPCRSYEKDDFGGRDCIYLPRT